MFAPLYLKRRLQLEKNQNSKHEDMIVEMMEGTAGEKSSGGRRVEIVVVLKPYIPIASGIPD